MKDKQLGTTNKLNTPYNNNVETKKARANKVNSQEYNYEFGKEASNLTDTTSRYNYEFGNETNASSKDSALARGSNIANAFSYPLAGSAEPASNDVGNFARYNEEYARENVGNTELRNANKMKKQFQNNLRQNYNVEFSEDELIDDECDHNCNNCPRCR